MKRIICSSCQMGKSCRLPFISPATRCDEPFTKIHSDLWGPSPDCSTEIFRYYVIFIDVYSRFTWLYPFKKKSEFFACFIHFHKYVECQFNKKIQKFQSDGGGEYSSDEFRDYLSSHGIIHQVSFPTTPEQNGFEERKHKNIQELGLTMMLHANIPKKYWIDCFSAAVFLINRLPTPSLGMESPFFCLLGKQPDYFTLRVFGCKCFPYLGGSARTKLDPKSWPCVFLGYSSKHKGYRCLYPPTSKIYIS